ncbi:hypothetical protein Ancab_033886 [Ancistrocladus abbreviatus]
MKSLSQSYVDVVRRKSLGAKRKEETFVKERHHIQYEHPSLAISSKEEDQALLKKCYCGEVHSTEVVMGWHQSLEICLANDLECFDLGPISMSDMGIQCRSKLMRTYFITGLVEEATLLGGVDASHEYEDWQSYNSNSISFIEDTLNGNGTRKVQQWNSEEEWRNNSRSQATVGENQQQKRWLYLKKKLGSTQKKAMRAGISQENLCMGCDNINCSINDEKVNSLSSTESSDEDMGLRVCLEAIS